MTTTSKAKSRFNQVLSKIDARRFCESNRQKYIDCLKPRSKNKKNNKISLSVKNVVAITFSCPNIKVFNL